MQAMPPPASPTPAPAGTARRNLANDPAALPDAWKPSHACGRCGGSCPPREDGFCQKFGFPATRNYGG